MRARGPSPLLQITKHPLPQSDFFGGGVCFKDRDPGTEIDTVIVHSCYVEERILTPALIEEIGTYSEERARELGKKWKELNAAAQAATNPDEINRLRSEAQAYEFLAIHTMLFSRSPSDRLGEFSIDGIRGIFEFYGVSAHYLLSREGSIVELVPPDLLAFHAGKSQMPRPEDRRERVNNFSIGIELLGTKESGFTDEQYRSLSLLGQNLLQRFPIKNFYGHSDIASGRKTDPENFDWKRFKSLISAEPTAHFPA